MAVLAVTAIEATLSFAPDRMAAREIQTSTAQFADYGNGSVVIYGDSVAAGGIDERILSDQLGLQHNEVNNLALPGTTILYASHLLRRQLALGQKPDLIILAYQLPGYSKPQPRKFLSHFAGLSEFAQLLSLHPAPRDLVAGAIQRLSFTARASNDIRALILNGDLNLMEMWNREPFGIARRDDYFEESTKKPIATTTMLRADLAPDLRDDWKLAPLAENALKDFLSAAEHAGVAVLFAPPPLRPAVAESTAVATSTLSPIIRAGGGLLAPVATTFYPDKLYRDPVHLSPDGRGRFSEELAGTLSTLYPIVLTAPRPH